MVDNKLNDHQLAFVQDNGNILLLASAGTGKTRSVAAKVSSIINEKRIDGSRILCLSFTNKACEEMKERIFQDAGSEAFSATIKTFHAFCYEIIAEEKRRTTGLFPEEIIYDEDDCLEIVKTIVEGNQDEALKFINFIEESRIRKQIFTDDNVSDLIHAAETLSEDEKATLDKNFGKKSYLLDAFFMNKDRFLRSYEETLEENHALDFNDLVAGTYRLFLDAAVVQRWQAKYSFIFIDEAQDTSTSEYLLLKKIFGSSQIVLCGDFFQTIYQWRGSDPDAIISDFKKNYFPEIFSFDINYRSTKTLVDASFCLLKSLFGDRVDAFYPNGVVASRSEIGLPINIHESSSPSDEARIIYNEIISLRDLYLLSSMCILTRSNHYGLSIASFFRRQDVGLDCFVIGDLKFYRRPEIKDVLSFLRLLINPHDSLAVARIANKYVTGVGPVTLNSLMGDIKCISGVDLSDFVNLQTLHSTDPYSSLLSSLENGCVVVFDTETTGLDVNHDEIVQISAERIDAHGHALAAFNRFIRPTISVGSSEAIHGYSDAFLQSNGENAPLVIGDFLDFIQGCLLVGHNVSFDMGILYSELRRYHLSSEPLPYYYDTCVMAKSIYKIGPKNYKLSYLSQDYFHFKHVSSHKANDDVAATTELLLKMVQEDLLPETLQRQQIIGRYAPRFINFATALDELRDECDSLDIDQLVDKVISTMKISQRYQNSTEVEAALENLVAIAGATKEASLSSREAIQEFLNVASLSNTEIDALCKNKNMLPIITVHQAKGAEFDVVFLAGASDNQFPNYYGDPEEEKRIFYVAITRAKERLYISYPIFSDKGYPQDPSRYISYLPPKDLKWN